MLKIPKTDLARVYNTPAYNWAFEAALDASCECELVKLAALRFDRDLKRDDLYFDLDAYERVVRYYSMFRHTKGLLRGRRFELRPDQEFFIGQIMAWKRRDTGARRITETYKEVARKNGKSWEAGGLAGYFLTSNGESEPEVCSLATSAKQAAESWNAFRSMSRTAPRYSRTLEYRIDVVRHPRSGGKFEPLPSVGENLDGRNPSFILIDEYHLFKRIDDLSRDSLKGGTGARSERLEFKITTGGSNPFGSCYEERKRAIDVLRGTADIDNYLPLIFTLDKGDDWTDERNWHKANPALGISKELSAMRELFNEAQYSPRLANAFKNKQLDLWTNAAEGWLSVDAWNALARPRAPEELRGKRCIVGMDLSDTNDLTAFSLLFPPQEGLPKYYLRTIFFCPREPALIRQTNKVPYLTWADAGYIRYSGEHHIDSQFCAESILAECDKYGYSIEALAYDHWKAYIVEALFKSEGFPTIPIGQNFRALTPACHKLEELIDDAKLEHDGNLCQAFCVGNAVLDVDANGNIKPNKKRSADKIDGVASLLDCIAYLTNTTDNPQERVIDDCPIRML